MLNYQKDGPLRGLNPGPPAPKAGIIPLDQVDVVIIGNNNNYLASTIAISTAQNTKRKCTLNTHLEPIVLI